MKRQYIFIAILALILPMLARGLWYYRGIPEKRPEIATPDYASFARPDAAVSTPDVEDIEELGGTVLLDASHGNLFTLNEIEALTSAIRARGGSVETIIDAYSLEIQLKTASAFVSVSPTLTYTQYETQLLRNFVERGGRMLVFADATRNLLFFDPISYNPIAYGDVHAANSLLKHWGIAIKNDYLYDTTENEGNFRNVLFDDFGKSELTFGLDQVALYGARSVEATSGLILLQAAETSLSSLNDAHDPNAGGAALSEDGNVAAFGDFTFLSPPYSAYTDNAILIQNLADFALTGGQARSLDLFPYVFAQTNVQFYISPDVERTSSLVTALGSLQSSLRYLNLTLEFVDDVPSSGDAILIGSFDATEDFEDYLKRADVEIDSDFISSVAFGDVNRSGNGVILFNEGRNGNTLVLLADNPDDLIALIGVTGYGTISSCLTSPQVAICSVGYGESSFDDFSEEPIIEETPSDPSQTTPEATPTPGG